MWHLYSDKQNDKNTSSVHWFILQIAAFAGAGPEESQEAGSPCRFPTWVAGAQVPGAPVLLLDASITGGGLSCCITNLAFHSRSHKLFDVPLRRCLCCLLPLGLDFQKSSWVWETESEAPSFTVPGVLRLWRYPWKGSAGPLRCTWWM